MIEGKAWGQRYTGCLESAMKPKPLNKTALWMWLVVALSSASALWMLSAGSPHKLDEGLVKAAKKIRL
jgi:hypothetical protein